MTNQDDPLTRGLRLLEARDLKGAEACLVLVEGEPGRRGQALAALGGIYLKTDRLAKAESSLLQALAIRRAPETYLLLGECYLHLGKHAQAENAFQEAMRRAPNAPEPCVMLGHALAAQDRLGEAIRAYEQALLRDGSSVSARYYLAEVMVRQGELPRAATQLHYLLQREPTYAPAILLMGDMAFHQKDYRQAIVEYCRAREIEPLEGPVYERLGQAFMAIEDAAQALKAFEASIKDHPSYWPCYLEAARICQDQRQLRKARRYYHAIAYVAEYRTEAAAAIARIDAHFAQFDLANPEAEGAIPENADFRPPETLSASQAQGTTPLDPTFVLHETAGKALPPSVPRPASHAPAPPEPSSGGGLTDWVQSKTGQLKGLKDLFKKPGH